MKFPLFFFQLTSECQNKTVSELSKSDFRDFYFQYFLFPGLVLSKKQIIQEIL